MIPADSPLPFGEANHQALIIVSATAAGKILGYLDENLSRL